jgi:hypothetical protein
MVAKKTIYRYLKSHIHLPEIWIVEMNLPDSE